MKKIAIIGAGISGMVCGHECQKKGHQVTVFDKSHGVSGRSSTKYWDDIAGIGIDMGIPYIEESDISNIAKSLIQDLIDNQVLSYWPATLNKNGKPLTIKTYVGSPKMNQIAHYFSESLDIIPKQKITRIEYNNSQWTLQSENDVFHGFDQLVIAIPAPQIAEISGVSDDILSPAKDISYAAVNTLLLEMKSPLWFDDYEEDVMDGPIIKTVIADYLKPNRMLQRFTYAIHSQPGWATKRFDELDKETVSQIMLAAVLTHYHRKEDLILKSRLHQWKYAYLMGASDSLQTGYLRSKDFPLYACGDWCHGHTFMRAIESGYLLAHNIGV